MNIEQLITTTDKLNQVETKHKDLFLDFLNTSLNTAWDTYRDILHNPANEQLRKDILVADYFELDQFCEEIQTMYLAWQLYVKDMEISPEDMSRYLSVFHVILFSEMQTFDTGLSRRDDWSGGKET